MANQKTFFKIKLFGIYKIFTNFSLIGLTMLKKNKSNVIKFLF